MKQLENNTEFGNKAVVYKITCLNNNKFYIGVSKNFSKRMSGHKNKPVRKMLTDIEKYGWDNFSKEIIYYGDEDSCYKKEIEYIAKMNPVYNTDKGGRIGGTATGEENSASILKEVEVIAIRQIWKCKTYVSQINLAKYFGVDKSVISDIVLGKIWKDVSGPISIPGKGKISYKDIENIRNLYKFDNYTQKELSNIYNIDKSYVSLIVLGKVHKDIGGHISESKKYPAAKLTDIQVKTLREKYREGMTKYEFSTVRKQLDIKQSTIRNIVNGRSYRDAPGPIKNIDY